MGYNIDLQELADTFGFELEEVEMVVEMFFETSEKNLADIENAIQTNNLEELSKAAHSLKGSSSTLKLTKISEIAKEIELSAKNEEKLDYQGKYEELKELIDNLKMK